MIDAERRLVVGIGKIGIELLQRCGNQQSLVDDRAMRKGGYVEVADLVSRGGVLDFVSSKEETALIIIIRHSPRFADENMLNAWHGHLRLLAKHPNVDRNLTPAEKKEAPFLEDFLGNCLGARLGIRIVVRKKQHPDTKIPLLIQGVAQPGHFRNKELVGDLCDHPGAVSRFGISIQGPSMHEAANRSKSDTKNAIGATSAYLRNKADTARVMLMLRIV